MKTYLPSNKVDRKEALMLEHPEIGWIWRTGYPSWLQERGGACPRVYERRTTNGKNPKSMGRELSKTAGSDQQLCPVLFPAPAQDG
jgi:hypothetical protein